MHDAERFFGTAIAWTGICLFWLAVNVFDGWVQRNVYPPVRLWFARLWASAREKIGRGHPRSASKELSRSPGRSK